MAELVDRDGLHQRAGERHGVVLPPAASVGVVVDEHEPDVVARGLPREREDGRGIAVQQAIDAERAVGAPQRRLGERGRLRLGVIGARLHGPDEDRVHVDEGQVPTVGLDLLHAGEHAVRVRQEDLEVAFEVAVGEEDDVLTRVRRAGLTQRDHLDLPRIPGDDLGLGGQLGGAGQRDRGRVAEARDPQLRRVQGDVHDERSVGSEGDASLRGSGGRQGVEVAPSRIGEPQAVRAARTDRLDRPVRAVRRVQNIQ